VRKSNKIAVLGGGLWGTVLAQHLSSQKGIRVWLWEFFADAAESLARSRRHPHIPGFRLDDGVRVTSDLGAAAASCDVLVVVLPSSFVRRTAKAAAPFLSGKPFVVVNASKGVEPGTLMTMGEILEEELPKAKAVYTLSGPSFAREVAKGVPTKMLLAGPAGAAVKSLEKLFDGGPLRVAWTKDRKGVELGGSLKNVLAIGAGILDGLEAGANTKAALITQGMGEMGQLIRASGGRAETVFGLSGLGDLIATGTSGESRNRGFGEKLGRGTKPARAQKEIPTVVEGVEAADSARALLRRSRVKAPLLEAIWSVVHESRPARQVLRALGF
jgi:glycerol-3-phosphate dehydrogenase (NAD(P)+)